MTINIKYKIGQVVWFMKDNKIRSQYIYDIQCIRIDTKGIQDVTYGLNSTGNFKEWELFESKNELMDYLDTNS